MQPATAAGSLRAGIGRRASQVSEQGHDFPNLNLQSTQSSYQLHMCTR